LLTEKKRLTRNYRDLGGRSAEEGRSLKMVGARRGKNKRQYCLKSPEKKFDGNGGY